MDFNEAAPLSGTAKLDGFVKTAAHDARTTTPPFTDIDGLRAMSYYDGTDLPYYYFMASSFATSDRWFSPVMTPDPAQPHVYAGRHFGGTRVSHSEGATGADRPNHLRLAAKRRRQLEGLRDRPDLCQDTAA